MIEPVDLGPRLQPPRGGLARLQQSVRRSHLPDHRRTFWLTAAITGMAASLVLLVSRGTMQNRKVRFAIEGAILAAQNTQFDHAAFQVLPSHGRDVRILLIGSLPAPARCYRAATDHSRSKPPSCPPQSG